MSGGVTLTLGLPGGTLILPMELNIMHNTGKCVAAALGTQLTLATTTTATANQWVAFKTHRGKFNYFTIAFTRTPLSHLSKTCQSKAAFKVSMASTSVSAMGLH